MIGYDLKELLEGKYYRSHKHPWRNGIIKEAVRREDVWSVNADNVFAVRVRNEDTLQEFWATVWIAVED